MEWNSTQLGTGDSSKWTAQDGPMSEVFGDAATSGGEWPDAVGGGDRDVAEASATIETRDRTAASVFEEVKQQQSDDVEAVFDHYDVDSPAEVMAAEENPPEAARSRNDPLVVGDVEGFDVGDVLLDERQEGEEFNWVASDVPAAEASSISTGSDAVDGGAVDLEPPEPLGSDATLLAGADPAAGFDAGEPTGTGTTDRAGDAEPIELEPLERPGAVRRFIRRLASLL